jgi:hypothetical protein
MKINKELEKIRKQEVVAHFTVPFRTWLEGLIEPIKFGTGYLKNTGLRCE